MLALATGLPEGPLAAQAGWGPPRPPRELIPANSKVENGIQALRGADKPDQRDPQLAQAKKALGEAALYASGANDDSAFAYYRLAARTAGDDAAFAHDRQEALSNAWHLAVRKVPGHPAAQRAARVRASLDSIQRGVTSDSTALARLSAPLHLTFEFLDVTGQVIATLTQDVPAMPPRQSQAFDLKVSGKRISGWRYRAC